METDLQSKLNEANEENEKLAEMMAEKRLKIESLEQKLQKFIEENDKLTQYTE